MSADKGRPVRELREVRSLAELRANPVGRWLAGPTYAMWYFDAALNGTAFWGTPSGEDAEQLVACFECEAHPQIAAPYSIVTDGSRLEHLGRDAFVVMEKYLRETMTKLAHRVRRHAVVHGAGMAGALTAGALTSVGLPYESRACPTFAEAFEWVERPEATATITALLATIATRDPTVATLRAILTRSPEISTIHAAKELGVSLRGLQRALAVAGTSFREQQTEVRLAEARRLLETTDEKIESIARELGFGDASYFGRWFSRLTGQTPASLRRH